MKRILILCTGNSCRSQMAMQEVGIDLSMETPKNVELFLGQE